MTTYQRLGDYIREVNVRNRELKVTNLLGLTISTRSLCLRLPMPLARICPTYKVVIQREQFACSLMQVSNETINPYVLMFGR